LRFPKPLYFNEIYRFNLRQGDRREPLACALLYLTLEGSNFRVKENTMHQDYRNELNTAASTCSDSASHGWWGRRIWLPLLLLSMVSLSACHWHDDDDDYYDHGPDYRAPAVPQGLFSITGDEVVDLQWISNTESDLDGYRIYRNDTPTGYFDRIGTVGRRATTYTDRGVRNGETYYYAIAAFDHSGNESDLTEDRIFDTPRPEGFDLGLENADRDPEGAGYDFSRRDIIDFRDRDADIYFWYTEDDGYWMVATERSDEDYSDIQDAGYQRIENVDWAPDGGWAPTGDVPLIEGHTYVVWTWDNHFAKFRVLDLAPSRVTVDWAYQTDHGNPELSIPLPFGSKGAGGGDRVHRVGPERKRP